MDKAAILALENIDFYYDKQQVLENISLDLYAGDFAALIGPNGGGKTTLIKIILGLLKPANGKVSLLGNTTSSQLRKHREAIAYVPQFANFQRDFPISVFDTVLQGRLGKSSLWGFYSSNDKAQAEQAMRETYTWEFRNKPISALSGGQLQRVLVARAIAGEPRLLLLDEPTANIDERAEKDIFELFKDLNQRMSIIVISHDISFVSQYVNRVFCLNKTLLCHSAKPVEDEALLRLYGEHVNEVHHGHHHHHH